VVVGVRPPVVAAGPESTADPRELVVDAASGWVGRLIVIIVGLFRIDRTTACGRTGKSLQ
jgi:hypothetical protein